MLAPERGEAARAVACRAGSAAPAQERDGEDVGDAAHRGELPVRAAVTTVGDLPKPAAEDDGERDDPGERRGAQVDHRPALIAAGSAEALERLAGACRPRRRARPRP